MRWLMRNERWVWIGYVALGYYVHLVASMGTPLCFDDCKSYVELMGRSSVAEYFTTFRSMVRAWSVPVFFSLFGRYSLGHAANIVLAQTTLLYVSWILLARAGSCLFSGVAKRVAFVVLSLCSFAQGYYYLNHFLLSDSFAMSSVLLFLAGVISFHAVSKRAGRGRTLVGMVILGLVACGARDANVLIVAMGSVFLVLANWKLLNKSLVLAFSVAMVLVCANQMAHGEERHQFNIENILAGFVLPTPAVREYFQRRGMPSTIGAGIELPTQPWCAAPATGVVANRDAARIPRTYLRQASRTYALWLVTHPWHVLRQTVADADCILGQSFTTSYALRFATLENADVSVWVPFGGTVPTIQKVPRIMAPLEYLGPDRRLIVSLIASCILLVRLIVRRDRASAVIVFLVGTGLLNAVGGYFGDLWETNEMLRHALIGSVLFNVGGHLACFFVGLLLMLTVVRKAVVEPAAAALTRILQDQGVVRESR